MARLNKVIRSAIINNAVIAAGVETRKEALKERRINLAHNMYVLHLGGQEKLDQMVAEAAKIEKLANKLSDAISKSGISYHGNTSQLHVVSDYEIQCNFGGQAVNLHFNGDVWPYEGLKPVYKDFIDTNYCDRATVAADHEYALEFTAIEEEQKVIQDLETQVRAEVEAMVNSVTTVEKLLKEWPEAKDLLPDTVEKPKGTGLQVNVQNLNAMIGLPKDEDLQA